MAAFDLLSHLENASGETILDGTNNAGERANGRWIKERYGSMRGYKRDQFALNVSRLITYFGNHLAQGLDLAQLVAYPLACPSRSTFPRRSVHFLPIMKRFPVSCRA